MVSVPQPIILPGDANDDGIVNIADVTVLIDYMLSGNHDCNQMYYTANGTGFITRGERFAFYGKHNDVIQMQDGSNTFYYDVPNLGLRVVCLDSLHEDDYYLVDGYSRWGFTADEVAWVENEALDTDNAVVFFCHVPCTSEYSYGGMDTIRGASMRGKIEAFIAGGGTVVGWFHGHTHWDFIGQYSSTNGFHEVSTGAAKAVYNANDYIVSGQTYIPTGATVEETRELNTTTQELWDVIVIKPLSREVQMIRFGAGSDRQFTY